MAETKINEQLNIEQNEFYFVTKTECDVEESTTEVDDDIHENLNMQEDTTTFYNNLRAADDSIDDFDPDINAVLKKKIKSEWDQVFDEENTIHDESSFDDSVEDEETIATFITSTGQQLALYAVEDSDEVFAVAEYNESGEPPTNFQFLMKSDVEKLIGEGAVRTVRKPAQVKKQMYHGNDVQKELSLKKSKKYANKRRVHTEMIAEEVGVNQKQTTVDRQENRDNVEPENDLIHQDSLDVSYDISGNSDEFMQNVEPSIVSVGDEMIQESTVQNIFHDDDQSDSELTFDEIEKSLAFFNKTPSKLRSILKKSFESPGISPERPMNGLMTSPENVEVRSPITSVISRDVEKPVRRILTNSGTLRSKHIPRALLGRKSKAEPRATVFIHGSTALICCPIEEVGPELKIAKEAQSPDSGSKIKRPRKQQLKTVDRADSEIIIQPASLVEETEEEPMPKKRGRRKKKRPEFPLRNYSKQISKPKRPRIEVIEIDVDEEQERHIEEITIDDSKEKESSDKENEVIMVDSDEEDMQEEKQNSVILKCEHCSRSFRQKRALDTHSRVCPKSPTTRRKIEKGNRSKSNDDTNTSTSTAKKQYVCKICSEKFDVVVALARHVRSHHKKKVSIVESEDNDEEPKKNNNKESNDKKVNKTSEVVEQEGKKMIAIVHKTNIITKKQNKTKRIWKAKKLTCSDCSRWFASFALLSAHYLHHKTKNSDKQTKRCQLCRKLFKSRLTFLQHMKLHKTVKKLKKTLRRARQSTTSKSTNLRKRGRSRNL